MTNDPTPENETPKKHKPSTKEVLRKFVFWMIIALMIWGIGIQLIPRLLFDTPAEVPVEQPLEAASEEPAPDFPELISEPEAELPAVSASPQPDISKLESQIALLQNLVDELQKRPVAEDDVLSFYDNEIDSAQSAIYDNKIATLESRMDALSEQIGALNTRITVDQLVAQLRNAINTATPYPHIMIPLENYTSGNDVASKSLELLRPYAEVGVPTIAQLTQEFTAAIPKALAQNNTDGSLMTNLSSLVTVRKVGDSHTGSDDDAIIARAESAIIRGSIQAAFSELNSLSAPAKTIYDTWLIHAQAHITAHQSLRDLELAITPKPPATHE